VGPLCHGGGDETLHVRRGLLAGVQQGEVVHEAEVLLHFRQALQWLKNLASGALCRSVAVSKHQATTCISAKHEWEESRGSRVLQALEAPYKLNLKRSKQRYTFGKERQA
jgi:hypothetical protein